MPDYAFDGQGVRLQAVMDDSPAERAGLREGDVIVAFDGDPVEDIHEYSALFFDTKPGEKITLTIVRDGDRLQREVVVARRQKR